MAKAPVKSETTKTPAKKAAGKTASKASTTVSIDKVAEQVHSKLKSLNLEPQLQADIEWCLGSYRFDKNPAGLADSLGRAASVLKTELGKKTKGVTAAFVTSVEKAIK